jgi:corrinoid protein of di/trimethylamine methyltransferase
VTDRHAEPPLAAIVDAFTGAEYERIPDLVEEGLRLGIAPDVLLDGGLVAGIREVGEMFRCGQAFLPEMMLAAEGLESGMEVLEPLLAGRIERATKGTVVIGTVKGDIHSLGKNIVATLLRTSGFEVVDLGVDVRPSRFVATAIEAHADVIAACALMTTTLPQQREVVEHLKAAGRREDFSVMVGGASATPEWAAEIGADAYGATAADAVALAEEFGGRARRG